MKNSKILTLVLVSSLAGCATNPNGTINWAQTNTNVATATAAVKAVGQDIVTFDCSNAALIYVIAKDANAQVRVQAALAKNAQIAKDACPALGVTPSVVVQTGTVVTLAGSSS